MTDKRTDLPVNSDINKRTSDRRLRQQEEYDNLGKDASQKESDVRNTQRSEQLRDQPEED